MTILEDEIRISSDLAAYPADRDGLPSLDTFVAFIAKRLCDNDGENPISASICVERRGKHSFRLDGKAKIDREQMPIEGCIVWLPKLACFRGHITVDPEGRMNKLLAEDADAVRSIPWREEKWHGDDHDHCRLCMATLSRWCTDTTSDNGYTAENCGWLCPNCYNDVVVAGGQHPWLKPRQTAT